ncbi:MAG: DUF4844 domain-containing protein [Bacteroidota bacterium]|nr:DUF4844 domain-containing protein [Bacteroidota bacterium]
MDTKEIYKNIISFRDRDKFKHYAYLQPAVEFSIEEDKVFINAEINSCCDQLLHHLESANLQVDLLRQIVLDSIEKIKDSELDTEDKEFCYELFLKIEEILGIDVVDKNISIGPRLLDEMKNIMKKGGLNMDDFI